jgi:hypothetical protein
LNSIRKLSTWTGILLILFLLSGCSKPVLTQENSYSIITISPDGEIQKQPIQLTWNSNAAVMKELLLEASFVLSDLHTQISDEAPNTNVSNQKSLIDISETRSNNSNSNNKNNKNEVSNNPPEPLAQTILLEANFPETKQFDLTIDDNEFKLDVSSIQIEVDGKNPGRVIINQVLILQGISNPNLKLAYEEFTEMLNKTKREALE